MNYRRLLDWLKLDLVDQNEIFLIIFPESVYPYMNHTKQIQDFIIDELEKLLEINIKRNLIPQYDHRTPEFGQFRLDFYL